MTRRRLFQTAWRVPFDALRSAIEFYNCINTARRRQVRTFRERELSLLFAPSLRFLLFLFLLFFSFTPGEKTTRPRGREKEGIFSLQDLRRPSIDERANECAELQAVFQSESLENRRWRECGPYLFCRPFLPPAGRSRARTRLIFKVSGERNESRVSARFELVLSILRATGLLILRYC